MAESAPTSPVKTPTKTKKSTKVPVQDSSAKKPNRPKNDDMILKAVNFLTQGRSRGVTTPAICNYIKKEYEIENPVIMKNVRLSIKKLMENGDLIVASGDKPQSYKFKLEENIRKKFRTKSGDLNKSTGSAKKKATTPKAKPAAAKKTTTPKKDSAKKKATTPKAKTTAATTKAKKAAATTKAKKAATKA